MATRAAERRSINSAQIDDAPSAAEVTDLLFQLVDSLKAGEAQRKGLLSRLRASVEKGDRQIAALASERPSEVR